MAEVMVASTISVFALAGTTSAVLMCARSGAALTNYVEMETQARKALELFGQDARMAKSITWSSATSVTLTIPTAGSDVTCAYTLTGSTFTRTYAGGTAVTLVTGVTRLEFSGYRLDGTEVTLSNLAQANIDTKQVQLSLWAQRNTQTVATNTHTVLSARFIMRNKIVTS